MKLELDESKPENLTPPPKREIESADVEEKPTSIKQRSSACLSLLELSNKFIKSRQDRGYSEKTTLDYMDSNNLFLEAFGDISIDSLSHQHDRDYVQLLKRLPANRKKKCQKQNNPTVG